MTSTEHGAALPFVGRPQVVRDADGKAADRAKRIVLFLDVDGVCHPLDAKGLPARADYTAVMARGDAPESPEGGIAAVVAGEFELECMQSLRCAIEASGAQVVLSSTWRETEPQSRAVDRALAAHGIPFSVGSTPRLSILDGGRPAEILEWVSRHEPEAWVAVDDVDLCSAVRADRPKLEPRHFVKCDPAVGFTPQDADRVVSLLLSQLGSSRRAPPAAPPPAPQTIVAATATLSVKDSPGRVPASTASAPEWPARGAPPPFSLLEVRQTPGDGRGCFASRDIPAGAPILLERPLALSPIRGVHLKTKL